MADISKITLPSGNTYNIKDQYARDLIAELGNFNRWLGVTTTPLSDGSTTNPIVINGVEVTAEGGDIATYQSEEFIYSGEVWQKFGDLSGLGAMAYVDKGTVTIKPAGTNAASAVSFSGGASDVVLGEATTFTNGTSSVSFGNHTKATVLKSDVTATVPAPSGTTKYMKATASGTAVGVATSNSAITSLGDPSTGSFVTSYPGTTSKLVTSTVTGVSGSTTASKATAGTAIAVATTDTAKTVANGSLGTETTTRTANTPMWGATVSDETLSFTFKPLSTVSVTPAKSNGSITPYTFADVTVPKAAASATTVATGALSANGGGSSVMTGLGTASKSNAVTGYPDVSSDTFAKTVSVTAQPTITLASESSTATGRVAYISAVGTSGTNAVTFATSGHTADAITALGAATAAAQKITVGTNDKVTAVTNIGTGTAAAQKFTGTSATHDVNPKTT